MPDEIITHSLTSADRDVVLAMDQSAFGFDDRNIDPETDTVCIEWDRAFGTWRNGALAAIYVVFSYGLGVPGRPPELSRVVPMAGLSWVAVHPDHRRRGLLTHTIRHHLDTVHASGHEAISCLFASEAGIYGRFGYGVSTDSVRLTLPAKAALRGPRDLGDVTTRFAPADPALHDGVIKEVYDAECLLRPGHTVQPPTHRKHYLEDPPARRPGGAEALKIVIAERSGRPTGYAVVRRSVSWGEAGPEGKVAVNELVALDPQSAHALWRRVLDFDLMAEVTTPLLPLDHPLTVWAGETVLSSKPGYRLWTRIVDVPAALASRGYAADLDVVLQVSDALCPWNDSRWRLTARGDSATCEPTTDAADLALDVRELGSAYLGGVTLVTLGAAGLVDELAPGALATCSAAWRSAVLPATPSMF